MFNKSFLAFALLHVSVPIICVIFFAANPIWIIGSLVFAVATVRSLHTKSPAFVVSILCLLSGLSFTLTLMLGTSYYMLGEGFDDAFYYHLNTASLVIAARGYGSLFYPALLALMLAFIAPAIIRKTNTRRFLPAVPALLLWVMALASNYPAYSLTTYRASLSGESAGSSLVSKGSPGLGQPESSNHTVKPGTLNDIPPRQHEVINPVTHLEQVPEDTPEPDSGFRTALSSVQADSGVAVKEDRAQLKKNVILIYAESLEALYFDRAVFADLLPNIRALSARAHRFTNLRQVRGTGWTIAGIVASECGFPLQVSSHLASNSTIASVERPYPNETCLADILSRQGYETVYMGGAPLWFAGKGNFLKTHGYKRIYGDEELAPLLQDKNYQSGWGIYDDSLFEMVLKELQSLERGTQPYLLTLLTLDTHHPNGLRSKSCKKLEGKHDSMSNAIYCSDQLISRFITKAMAVVDMNRTIIVLFSDHLSLRNKLWKKLRAHQQDRRLTFMIFDGSPGSVSDVPGTHFDVGPTLLEAAGVHDPRRPGSGFSLFSKPDRAAPSPSERRREPTPVLLDSDSSARTSGVDISKSDLSLRIGNLTLTASDAGREFVSGMFLALFNEAGNVMDVIYSDDYELLANNLDGQFVVGISILPDKLENVTYFYGRISKDGKGIVQKYLREDTHLGAEVIVASM